MLVGKVRGPRMVSSHCSIGRVPRAPSTTASGWKSAAQRVDVALVGGAGVPLHQRAELVVVAPGRSQHRDRVDRAAGAPWRCAAAPS